MKDLRNNWKLYLACSLMLCVIAYTAHAKWEQDEIASAKRWADYQANYLAEAKKNER